MISINGPGITTSVLMLDTALMNEAMRELGVYFLFLVTFVVYVYANPNQTKLLSSYTLKRFLSSVDLPGLSHGKACTAAVNITSSYNIVCLYICYRQRTHCSSIMLRARITSYVYIICYLKNNRHSPRTHSTWNQVNTRLQDIDSLDDVYTWLEGEYSDNSEAWHQINFI